MHTEKNILLAFLLNLSFSIIEFIGGLFTNSVAIMSDSIHDLGDSLSIGVSYLLEKKSKKKPDDLYTYGYIRYSVLGAIITTTILIVSSILVSIQAVKRIINPVEINYQGMLWLSVLGIIVNFLAVFFTRKGHSINQKAVNLHMLEDVLGWIIVFIGSIIMMFTNIIVIDSILSIILSLFILLSSLNNLKKVLDLFLEKVPSGMSIMKLKQIISQIDGVIDTHHVHIWSLDGVNNYATLHVVVNEIDSNIKKEIKDKLFEYGIKHVTIELENKDEHCHEEECEVDTHHHCMKMHYHH